MAWFFGVTTFILGSFFILITGIFHTGRVFEWMVKSMCRTLVFCVGIRQKTTGLENVDPQKQYILMMNHVNMLDPFLFYTRYPGKVRSVEEESHFKWPLYGWVIRRLGQLPINRKNARRALENLKEAVRQLHKKKDLSIIILPEGTRTKTGKLGEFKKGAFLLAIESGLDILPIIQLGCYKFKRKGSWIIRPGKVELIFEKPIPTTGYSRKTIADLMQKTRELFLGYVD
ncbi:MAG: 1-acyl-sn-glycerol-3-phosphate acyltransferase [Candidatus Aminicenantes bacterium]|nr:1-acyl-sn-glycerol-3-phosphate acyltransferase [Candidatus Aminicenantes bacterium]